MARHIRGPAMPAWCRGTLRLVVLVELASAVFSFARAVSGGVAVDFLAFDVGGRLAGTDPHSLYVLGAQNSALSDVLGYHAQPVAYLLYVNPPFAAEILRPLAALPLQAATDVFLVACVVALLATFALVRSMIPEFDSGDRTLIAAALVLSSSAAYSLLLGQWGPLLLLIAIGGLKLVTGGRPVAGGILFSLLLIKPQVAYLVPVALIGARNLRAAGSFVGSACALALVSLWVVGVGGAADYVHALRGYAEPGTASANSLTIPDLLARLVGHPEFATSLSAALALLAAAALLTGALRYRFPLAVCIGLALAAALVLSPHGNMQDFVVLSAGVLAYVAWQTLPALLFLVAADVSLGLWPLGVARPVTPVLVACGLVAAVWASVMSPGADPREGGAALTPAS